MPRKSLDHHHAQLGGGGHGVCAESDSSGEPLVASTTEIGP